MQNLYSVGTEDPDYLPTKGESSRETVNQSLLEQDAKEESVHKIQSIIHKQFSLEVHLKEREIELIDQRISQTRSMLDRLRACVLARYYGTSTKPGRERSEPGRRAGKRRFLETKVHKRTRTDARGNDTSQGSDASSNKIRGVSKSSSSTISRPVLSPTEASPTSRKQLNPSNDADRFLTSVNENSKGHAPGESSIYADLNRFDLRSDLQRSKFAKNSQMGEPGERSDASRSGELNTNHSEEIKFEKGNTTPVGQSQAGNQQGTPGPLPGGESVTKFPETDACLSHAGSRFYVKKRVIVGNTSKFIPLEGREANDKSTHKWMVYVRGPPKDPQIDLFIKKVWFFLHPSYRPNDIVEVNKPPFHLTRRGWGEFPIRVQLHFVDARNKRVDIIHELKLDRTYTGLQTLGAETVVDLELDRKTFEDLGIPVVFPTPPSPDPSPSVDRGDSALVKEEGDHSTQVRKKEIVYPVQIPQLKKLKVEEATYSELSPFSSIASTPVHSQASSRCTSPETVECCIQKFCDSTEQALREGVRVYPLIDPKRDLAKFPYCAESVEQYCRWNTGKRRAAEWQRALALRRHMQAKTDARDLSTKDVMLWCRRYGYTPCDKAGLGEKSCFCKMCGLPVARDNESEDDSSFKGDAIHSGCAGTSESFSSLSSSAKLLLSLEEKENSLPDAAQGNDDQEEVEVDVVGELPKRPAERKLQSPVYSLPLRPEEEWVREVCGDIGVKLRSVNFEGVESHAVERMLWSACSQFIEDILRQAWASAADQSSSCRSRLVVPRHVYQAIGSLPTCDFLLNSYLGSLEQEAEP